MKKKKKRTIKRTGKFYVYILRCKDKTLYTGYTPDLEQRVKKHKAGKGAKYTRTRLPVKLVWFKEYKYFKLAFMEELRIKKISKSRKEKLILAFKNKQKRKRVTQKKVLAARRRSRT